MSTTTSQSTELADPGKRERVRRGAFAVVRVLLAVQFAIGGVMKLTGTDPMMQMFDDIGVGQWLRYVVGAVELGAAVGLLVPAAAGLAALVVVGLMVGAVGTRAVVLGGPPVLEVLILALASLVVRHHGEQLRRPAHRLSGT